MENQILLVLLASSTSALASWAAVRIEIKWIIRTLEAHERHHESHYENNAQLRGIKYVKR